MATVTENETQAAGAEMEGKEFGYCTEFLLRVLFNDAFASLSKTSKHFSIVQFGSTFSFNNSLDSRITF